MSSLSFETIGNELILCYSPFRGVEDLLTWLKEKDSYWIKHTFLVTEDLLRESDEEEYDFEETLRFCIGQIGGAYTQIDSDVTGTDHQFYFANDISLKPEMFIAYRDISVLKKIDRIIEHDFYIGGKWEEKGGIPARTFQDLIKTFPKSAELDRYANSRISSIIKEFLPECDKYCEIFNKYIEKKNGLKVSGANSNPAKTNLEIELAQFSTASLQLEEMLSGSEAIPESRWQEKIQNILQLLYPKYILCTREISFKGVDGYDKRPDFMLVDTNGFVDILEIKKPDVPVLTRQASYRNNYVPVRELAGAIQQIEKYIFCLTSLEMSQKDVLKKLTALLPGDVKPEIVNPQGILLLGRSNAFNEQQRRDFELIKRQYKNITDIMTYDDLARRLKNIISSLKQRI